MIAETAMAILKKPQANADTQAKSLASEYQKTITEQNKIIQQQQAAAAASAGHPVELRGQRRNF